MKTRVVYKGMITQFEYGDNVDAIRLSTDNDVDRTPLVQRMIDDRDRFGNFVELRMVITDFPVDFPKAESRLLSYLDGVSKLQYQDQWSDVTGYLWTDQELRLGGHDIMAILENNIAQFALLEATYSNEEDEYESS